MAMTTTPGSLGGLNKLRAIVLSTCSVPHLLPIHLGEESRTSCPVASRGRAKHARRSQAPGSGHIFYVAVAWLPPLWQRDWHGRATPARATVCFLNHHPKQHLTDIRIT